MDRLASCELHPGACTGTARRLLDLLPEQRLRDWAEACRRSHAAFGDKARRFQNFKMLNEHGHRAQRSSTSRGGDRELAMAREPASHSQ